MYSNDKVNDLNVFEVKISIIIQIFQFQEKKIASFSNQMYVMWHKKDSKQ